MKLNHKLLILFLVPLLIVGLLSLSGLLWSRYHFTNTVTIDTSKVQAALEMEINDKEAFKNVIDYLAYRDKQSLISYQNHINHFNYYLAQYQSLPLTKKETQYLETLKNHFEKFQTHTHNLISIENDQINQIKQLNFLLNEKIETTLDDNWQKQLLKSDKEYAIKHNALLEIEINTYELASAVSGYILEASPLLKERIYDSVDDIEKWSNILKKTNLDANESVFFNQMSKYIEQVKGTASRIVALEDQKRSEMALSTTISKSMDSLLDNEIQNAALDDLTNTQQNVSRINIAIIISLALIMLLSILIAYWFIKQYFSKPVNKLKNIAEAIAVGKTDIQIDDAQSGEFGELYPSFIKLNQNTQNLSKIAKSLGEGKFDTDIQPRSKEDSLSYALIEMRNNLQTFDTENKQQVWIKTQIATIVQSAQSLLDIQTLAQQVISNLSETLNAGFGAFYSLEIENENDQHTDAKLTLIASYGYEQRKQVANQINIGEGLVGQCAFEKKSILLTEVPDDYIKISSGLGNHKALNIMVLPIIHNDDVLGVIEIASFHLLGDKEQMILKEVSNHLATIISNVISHTKTQSLLTQSQSMNEELQSQQQALATSNEALEKQTQALKQSEEELRSQSEELRVMNEELEEKTERLEQQKKELESAQGDLEQRAQDLALSSKYKSEFLANMSHELRTPLNSLLILSKKLSENRDGNLTEKQIKSAKIIHKGGHDLLTLINDILDLSKVEAGKLQVEISPCSITTICEDLKTQFEPMANDKGIDFQFHISDQLPETFESDNQRITQILRNFISNAFKFTETGSVTVKVSQPNKDLSIHGQIQPANQLITFSIIDTGIGIAKDKQRIIFEAFQQAEGSTSRQYGGTGLGLAISRTMADLLGGEITLESEENKGSIFSLHLPLKSPSPQKVAAEVIFNSASSQQSQVTGKISSHLATSDRIEVQQNPIDKIDKRQNYKPSILIVEDDETFIEILSDYAVEQGYEVKTASSGKDAIEKAIVEQPNAIILDLGLPDIDGIKVLETLKDNLQTRHIPIHVISARDENPQLKAQGALGYLKKPPTEDSLMDVFKRFSSVIQSDLKHILVIDDDQISQQAVCELIDNDTNTIKAVSSGKEALSYLAANQVDCIILDLNLPDQSGFEILDQLHHTFASLPPVVVYTARDLTEQEHQQLQKYTQSIVVKGVNSPNRLLDEVTLFLHSIENNLPKESRKEIKMLHSGDQALKNKKVLLVDDDMRNVFALSSELEEYALDVVIASNGQQAVDKLKLESDIHIVLMDIMMPVMDGYQAIEEIRKDKQFKNLPIIALTAKAMSDDKEKCIQAGANDYIAKPIDVDQLISMMKVWSAKS
ncbi:MAG: response regulator [Gammaproteobacteria bacterium]|nr:MAG: response regulator [Gammaproteobacteria bacterium]UTW42545.1 response regulator [bacterium SCSIO 12844]